MKGMVRWAGGIAVGTAFGQGLTLLLTPWLARMYTPAEFGALAMLMTVANLAATAGALRFDLAVPNAPEEEVRGLVLASLLAACALGGAAAASAWLLHVPARFGALASDRHLPLLLAACVVLPAAHQVTCSLLLRRRTPVLLGAARGSQGALFSAAAATGAPGLLWSQALSFGAGIGAVVRAATRRAGDVPWREVARRHWRYPVVSLPGAILDVLGFSQGVWIITAAYGASQVGQFSQVQRLIAAPLMLASVSLGQVLLRASAPLVGDAPALRALSDRVLLRLAAAAAALLVGVWIAGEPLFRLVLGRQWLVSMPFLLAVGVAVCVRACVSPLSYLLLTLRRFDLALMWQGTYCLTGAVVLRLLSRHLGFGSFVAAYAAHEAALYGLYLAVIRYAIGHPRNT